MGAAKATISAKKRRVSQARYNARRVAQLAPIADAPARVVKHPLWLISAACMRDTTGAEIERHLDGCAPVFAAEVLRIALWQDGDRFRRTWLDAKARRLATLCIFLAYLCQRSSFQGAAAWMIRGIPKGALAVATRLRAVVDGVEVVKQFGHTTLWLDLAELRRAGILQSHQFAWWKAPAWARGKPKTDAAGNTTQWAFLTHFLTVCPFAEGNRGRVVPCPRADHRDPTVPAMRPQVAVDAAKRDAQDRARKITPDSRYHRPGRVQAAVDLAKAIPAAILPKPVEVAAAGDAQPFDFELDAGFVDTLAKLPQGLAQSIKRAWHNSDSPRTGRGPPDREDS